MMRSTETTPRPPPVLTFLAGVGLGFFDVCRQVGGIAVLFAQLMSRLARQRMDRAELWRNLHKMGVESVSIVCVTAIFNGAIMVVQAAPLVTRFSATGIIGWGAGFAVLREVGPLLISLMYSGRVGANNTAELGTMVVTEQVDALRALAIDPLTYLILPRVVAMVGMLVVLDIIGVTVALGGAIMASSVLLDVDSNQFMSSFFTLLDHWDYLHGVIKSFVFGGLISLTSCYYGLTTSGGAPGVGRAVTSAVVAAAIGIFVLDYIATFIMR